MAKRLDALAPTPEPMQNVRTAIDEALGRPRRESIECSHIPPVDFDPQQELELSLTLPQAQVPISVLLHYRHVNQAERYQSAQMRSDGAKARATIPPSYTDSAFPIQYYFEVRRNGRAWLYPGLGPELTTQPYFVVRAKTPMRQAFPR